MVRNANERKELEKLFQEMLGGTTLAQIAQRLCESEFAPPAVAFAWAWRIKNQYPDQLARAAEDWVRNRPIEDVSVGKLALSTVQQMTGSTVPQALELMNLIEHDPIHGHAILAKCTIMDEN